MLPKRLWPFLCALSAVIAGAQASPPRPDFANLPGYIHALNASHDPQAAAIRKQIAAGPTALARERLAAQAAGVLLDASQLQRPLPPDGQNAAPLYTQLDTLRREKPLNLPMYAQPLGYGGAYTPEQIAAVQKIVESRRDVFDLMHRAADTPLCVFPRQWSQGAGVLFPELAGLRESARELNTESFLLARQGRYSEAIANQARGFRIAQHATSDPTLISYLVAVALDAITLSGMKNILYLAGPNGAVDAQVRQAIADNRPKLSLKYALFGEAALALATLGPLDKMDAAQFSAAFAPGGHSKAPPMTLQDRRFVHDFLAASEAQYLARMLPLIAAADQPGTARRAVFAATDTGAASPQSRNPMTAMNAILTPSFTLMEQKDDFTRAQEQVMMAAAAILAAGASTSGFPETLPDGFLDPFTGKPLGYRREGDNGFVVYSVGVDGTFRGGMQGQYKFNPFQVFFRYPGPTPQPVPPDMLK